MKESFWLSLTYFGKTQLILRFNLPRTFYVSLCCSSVVVLDWMSFSPSFLKILAFQASLCTSCFTLSLFAVFALINYKFLKSRNHLYISFIFLHGTQHSALHETDLSKILLTHLIFVTTCEGNFFKVCLLKTSLKLFFLKHTGIQTSFPYLALNTKANLTLIPIFKYLSKRWLGIWNSVSCTMQKDIQWYFTAFFCK